MAKDVSSERLAMRDFSESLPMALLQTREVVMAIFRPLLAEHDLTEQQWRVLRVLASVSTALEVGQVVEATNLLAPSLSRILKDLEARGLVTRSAVEQDQRRAQIGLSATGFELVKKIAPQSEALYNKIEASFGQTELTHLLDQLATLRDKTAYIDPTAI